MTLEILEGPPRHATRLALFLPPSALPPPSFVCLRAGAGGLESVYLRTLRPNEGDLWTGVVYGARGPSLWAAGRTCLPRRSMLQVKRVILTTFVFLGRSCADDGSVLREL
eukprot:4808436-Pyramimonas_sp.AAC.1